LKTVAENGNHVAADTACALSVDFTRLLQLCFSFCYENGVLKELRWIKAFRSRKVARERKLRITPFAAYGIPPLKTTRHRLLTKKQLRTVVGLVNVMSKSELILLKRASLRRKFNVFRRVRKICDKRLLASSCHVCPSVRMEHLDCHCTDFDKTRYVGFFRKSVEKIQILLKSDKCDRYFTWRRFHIFDNIWLNSS
jgi:hypothetical protein